MPEGDCLCHGDFHPINVLGAVSRPLVIDWSHACSGNPSADVCRSYLLLKLHSGLIAEPYLDVYCGINDMQRECSGLAALRRGGEIVGGRSR